MPRFSFDHWACIDGPAVFSTESTPVSVSRPADDDEDLFEDETAGPFSLTKTSADDKTEGEQDLSAADYDPNADKVAEERRHTMRLGGDMPAADYVEAPSHINTKLKADADKNVEVPQGKPGRSLDMFADEDDIFAEPKEDDKADNGIVNEPHNAPRPSGAPDLPSLTDNWDDPEGYYRSILGETFESRYTVYANLGKGVFSTVVKARDTAGNDRDVAIKIIRNNDVMWAPLIAF